MKARLHTTGLLVVALALNSCTNLGDDAFAHAMKSGNARMAASSIQPGQARLRIHEVNGRVYYPIHYTICRGDADATFALLQSGSPTLLDGRSLAYNAAKVKQSSLARQLAAKGYGTQSDIAQAEAENRQQRVTNNSAALGAIGIVALLALMGGGGSSHNDTEEEHRYEMDKYTIMKERGEIP